ncbi:hypothetical protein [Microbacterium aurantiacum]|uniref:Swt1-like HEPN domain-containing protein n=1 Tax=Microbacterium aurantiacum TaxID=162393 RepID=A0A0M8MRH4_9MICO|nr:hypothetical protein [Microbacterium chocolatum]ANG84570.1 hypothetical protein A8L33_03500 [Microbacterium chocolatum]KOS12310.1 hypothetical protein XI38_02795 [Microbacterium chocolatum]
MSATDYSDWILGVLRKAEQLRVVFLQLGSSNEPARRALRASQVTVTRVRDYLQPDGPPITGTVVIDGMESLTTQSEAAQMGALRERVFSDVEAGGRVILLSRAPRIAFPPVVGSSLLDDASLAHAPVVKSTGAHEWPTCVEDGASPADVLCRALTELGMDLSASLDRVVYESLLIGQSALGLLNARELEALDGSSLTAPDGATRAWNFPKHLGPLKKALDEVLADALEPQQQLAEVSSGLWKIERIIRREVRRRSIAAWAENWRRQCLNGDLPAKVLERASESAYMGATSVKQLRDPLEWLSLGELLQLKDRSQIGDLGLSAAHWRQFSAQIMPIRNRLAHMRSLRPEDAADVVKWQRVLEMRFPTN